MDFDTKMNFYSVFLDTIALYKTSRIFTVVYQDEKLLVGVLLKLLAAQHVC